jgi:small ligand-binding sensory domain FIST
MTKKDLSMADSLGFASALSTEADTARAVTETAERALADLGGRPDLAIAFVSHHHGPEFAALAAGLCDALGTETLIGCTGDSIVGVGREVEGQPALSLWLARMPGVTIAPMHLRFNRTPEGGAFSGWPDALPDPWPPGAALLTLGEPFTFPADALLERLNEDRPGVPVIGGMASGGWQPGQNRLLLGRRDLDEGAVAALVHGPVRIATVVSQGCRPIGRHFVVTRAERNVIMEMSGKPPLAQLQELAGDLTPAERQLVQRGLHVGIVTNEYQEHFERGDFLVRNVTGADPQTGAISIGDFVRPGQTVRFHIRDAASADEDLRALAAAGGAIGPPAAALLFTCNGRGTRLFSEPDHDAAVLRDAWGPIPLAGFFAQGELGPIGGRNFMHGFTASVAVFGTV